MPKQAQRNAIMAENLTAPVISVLVVVLPVLLLPRVGTWCGSRERS